MDAKGKIMIAIAVLIVAAVIAGGVWFLKTRGNIAPPAATTPVPQSAGSKVETKQPAAAAPNDSAKVIEGLKGIDLGDINSNPVK